MPSVTLASTMTSPTSMFCSSWLPSMTYPKVENLPSCTQMNHNSRQGCARDVLLLLLADRKGSLN
jgi:hypothetical protein